MALRHLLHPDAWDEGGLLASGVGDLAILLIMLPHANTERGDDNHEHGEPEQAAAGTAAPPGAIRRRFRNLRIWGRCQRPPRQHLRRGQQIEVVYSGTSAKTPWASLPSLRLRNRANR